jgi:hypothetical protein
VSRPDAVGRRVEAWSKGGEFLGEADIPRGGGGAVWSYAHCSVSRGTEERTIRFTLHVFGGGYRILYEEWGSGEDRALWLAPAEEEEESYIGLFSEEEVRERFPYLLAALEMPDRVEVDERGPGRFRVGG